MAIGDIITAPVQRTRFDFGFDGGWPTLYHIAGNVFAEISDGGIVLASNRLRTVQVNNDGTFAFISWVALRAGNYRFPHMVHVSGTVYAVVNMNVPPTDTNGYIDTVHVSNDGLFITYLGSTLFTADCTSQIRIIELSHGYFAIFYSTTGNTDRIQTVHISDDGLTVTLINNVQIDASVIGGLDAIHIAGNVYAIFYAQVAGFIGRLRTVNISSDGATIVLNSDLQITPANCFWPTLCHRAGNIYIFAYSDGANQGWIRTVSISPDGTVLALIASLRYDELTGVYPHIVPVGGDIYALFYNGGVLGGGVLTTVSVSADGLTLAIHDNADWNPGILSGEKYALRLPNTDIYALVHTEEGGDGWMATFNIESVALPTTTTKPATSVLPHSATLNGTLVDDGGETCVCGFQWGETIAYGNTTPTQSRTTGQTFSQLIAGLDVNKTYHFRAFATNSAGTGYGADMVFTTLLVLPTVTTDAVTGLGIQAATLNGTLTDDGGEACTCGFEWGKSIPYTTTTPTQSKITGQSFPQIIAPLEPATTYHFRAFATNSVGTSYGADIEIRTYPALSRAYALSREEM